MPNPKAAEISASETNGRVKYLNGRSPAIQSAGTGYRVFNRELEIESGDAPEFLDLTDVVKETIAESGVRNGQALVFSRHTTAAIKINENEPLLLRDMEHFLERCAPKDAYYGHNDFAIRTVNMHEDECPNGHSHCQHLILNSSETIPIVDGEPFLGEFQRVFFIELDELKNRRVLLQVTGI